MTKQLKKSGYIIYLIEDDLNMKELSTCLSRKDALHNYKTFMTRYEGRSANDIITELKRIEIEINRN